MNLQFITDADNLNGKMLEDGLMLETVYEPSEFEKISKVKYFLYDLTENEKTEIKPRSKKYDIFDITDCNYKSDNIYYTECDDQYDGTYALSVVQYNYRTKKARVIFSMLDRIENYPDKRQIKIFILNESNLLMQHALLRTNLKDNYDGFFDFTLLLFNFDENRKTEVAEENFIQNGIECIIPANDSQCVVKTGYSLLTDNRYEYLEREEAAIESVGIINREQLVSDLALKKTEIVMETIERTCFDTTVPAVSVEDGYIVYSTYEKESGDQIIHFYRGDSKETITCVNKNVTSVETFTKAYILNGVPYVRLNTSGGLRFYNLIDSNNDIIVGKDKIFNYISDEICILSEEKHSLLSSGRKIIEVYRLNDFATPIHREKGEFLHAAKDGETYYIFTK